MNNKIKVNVNDKELYVDKGITLKELSELFKDDYKYEIILAKVNNEYKELTSIVKENSNIYFYDLTTKDANRVYVNGLIFLLSYSYKKLFNKNIKVNHSLDKGLYITTENKILKEDITKLENKMLEIISNDIRIEKITTSRLSAIDYFNNIKNHEKAEIMKYNTNTYVTLYKLDDEYNYLYSNMPISTGVLSHFGLTYLDENAFILRFPTIYQYDEIKEYEHRKNVYNLFKDSRIWAKNIGLEYVSDLNEKISKTNINEIIRMDETKKNSDILNLSNIIANNKEVKIVLIAGPSSSGKTTTCNKIFQGLKSLGLNPKMISMDDYFVERHETPLDKDGNPDYEKLEAVDLKLFNDTMDKLLKGEETIVPTYNFLTGKKEFKNKMKLDSDEIILIEGIHALNPKLLTNVDKNKKMKIYLSALTELNIDKHVRISTTDNRLLRRMVRDNRTRGHDVEKTLQFWHKVREGEEENIFPYQDEADYTLNTAMIYEIGVLKVYAEPLLYNIASTSPYYSDAIRLLNFLRLFLPIPSDQIPNDSILREFIGGSCFNV